MPYSLHWHAPALIHRRFWGHVDGDELLAAFAAGQGDARFDALRLSVVDLSDITSAAVARSDTEMLAARFFGAALSNRRLRAVAIAPHAVAQQLVQAYVDVGLSPFPLDLLASRDEGNRWLARHGAVLRLAADGLPLLPA